MTFQLPDLPYAQDGLAPFISAETMSFHYGKHHTGYVGKLNAAIKETDLESLSLEDIIKRTATDPGQVGVFNNAAQVWNHTFYWNSMKPDGGGKPTGDLAKQIDADFASFEAFKDAFKKAASTQFGSGWAWLVFDGEHLSVRKTNNAKTPIVDGLTPLLTIDVWEHAYYLDYQNKRPDYIDAFFDNLVNWQFAEENFQKK